METRNHWGKNVFIARSDDNKRGYPPGSPGEDELQVYRDFVVGMPDAASGLVMERREKLVYLNLSLGFLLNRLNGELAPAAGLSAGFSFGDGD